MSVRLLSRMARKKVPDTAQAAVLLRARRRCCICFGLNRDTTIKQGQIAHLDRNRENDTEDNLAFLCLPCHDRYDSSSSQSKNFTVAEVKNFRRELEKSIEVAFSQPVQFGEAMTARSPALAGQYIRVGAANDSAELVVRVLPNGELRIFGTALWGTNSEYGPNTGTLDFIAQLDGNRAVFEDRLFPDSEPYRATLIFDESALDVEEQYVGGYFGMNVSFAGRYAKVT